MNTANLMALILSVAVSVSAAAVDAAKADPSAGCDWPNFQGPNYDCSSPEKGLLREWPKDGPKILWRAKLKQGWSCPSVSGNDVFVSMTVFEPSGYKALKEIVVCLDSATGQVRWQHEDPVFYNNNTVGWGSGGVRSTPAVNGKGVYTADPLGNIRCLDRATGRLVWEKALAPEFYFKRGMEQKGFCCSPLLYNNVVVVHGATGTKGKGNHLVYMMGLDAQTGKQLWLAEDDELTEKTTAAGGTGQSPVLAMLNNEPCAVASYNRCLRAVRISDGKEVLKFMAVPEGGFDNYTNPLIINNNMAVITPVVGSMVCDEIDMAGSELKAKQLWRSSEMYGTCEYHNFVHLAGYLYGINAYATNANNLSGSKLDLVCLDLKTGKIVWKEPGFSHGYGLLLADGLLFVRSFQTLSLVEATPEGFKLKGRMEKIHNSEPRTSVDMKGMTDCVSPVLSRGCLYIRCPDELLCIRVADDKLKAHR